MSIIGGARAFSNTASVTSAGKVTQVIGAVVDVQVRIKYKFVDFSLGLIFARFCGVGVEAKQLNDEQ